MALVREMGDYVGARRNSLTNEEGPVLPNQIAAGEIAGTSPRSEADAAGARRRRPSPLLVGTALLRVFEARAAAPDQDRDRRTARTGATLVTEGQTGANAFVILQGSCRVFRKGRRVAPIEAGGVVGELSLLNPAPCNATVVAETPLDVAILRRRDFLALLEHSPSISFKLLKSLAARCRSSTPAPSSASRPRAPGTRTPG